MRSFKEYIMEFTEGEIDRAPTRGTAKIFTSAAGYKQRGKEQFNPRASSLVHVTDYFPTRGTIKTTGEATGSQEPRETVHFTRNGVVGDHLHGKWHHKTFVTIMPEHQLQDRVLYSGDHDTFVYGGVDLPHGSRILVHGKRLDDAQKSHITKLVGATDWNDAHAKIKAFDPARGIHGHEVDFGGRKITISGLTDEEMESKTSLADATHRHLSSLGIKPIKIGQDYSVGHVDGNDHQFKRVYGDTGLVQAHYGRKRIAGSKYSSELGPSFKFQGSGLHDSSPHGVEERIAFDPNHPDRARLAGVLTHIRDNPQQYHPTAYSHPAAQAALKRQIARLS